MLAGICPVVYFAAAFITQALHCRALNSLFRSIAESYSTACTQRLAWITKPWMSCFPLKRWHGQPTCLQKVSLGYQPLQNRTSEKTRKAADTPQERSAFVAELSWERWDVFFSSISPRLQPFASTGVGNAGSARSAWQLPAGCCSEGGGDERLTSARNLTFNTRLLTYSQTHEAGFSVKTAVSFSSFKVS